MVLPTNRKLNLLQRTESEDHTQIDTGIMNNLTHFVMIAAIMLAACSKQDPLSPDTGIPSVTPTSSYVVMVENDVIYADGLGYTPASLSPHAIPLTLDIYSPDNSLTNRPVFMFIHGGGFQGGFKTKPEIVAMATYYASRGWIFVSIDYRTASDAGTITDMTSEEVEAHYSGIVPQEWLDMVLQYASSEEDIQAGLAMYAAQRDAKAALRWVVANASSYHINTNYITVGGASAGAITAIALGISDQEDFRDEIPLTDDFTLASSNLDQTYEVKSIVNFWGSNIKLELFESAFGLNRYDMADPELFTAHGTRDANPVTTYSEAVELHQIYDSLGIYHALVPLENAGHAAWDATIDGKSLSDLSYDFLVERLGLTID